MNINQKKFKYFLNYTNAHQEASIQGKTIKMFSSLNFRMKFIVFTDFSSSMTFNMNLSSNQIVQH